MPRVMASATPMAAGVAGLLLAEDLSSNPLEQLDQLPSLSSVERGHDFLAELPLECLPLLDMAASCRRELDQRRSAIARCRSTRQQAVAFERVHGGCDCPSRQPEMVGQVAHARRAQFEHRSQQASARDRAVVAGKAGIVSAADGLSQGEQRFDELRGRRHPLDTARVTEHTHYEYQDNGRSDDPLSESTTFPKEVLDGDFDVEHYKHAPPTPDWTAHRAAHCRGG